ncbi:XdhC family protein [Desulfosporosinus sp. OT]|uniref:XdhC family protein n=1 Tax=Desulfosporosinus sp. OT TaxID=913865 RepID=UPI0005915F2B|nr:XdhC family protein [Desulfosporosinus sp. OT]
MDETIVHSILNIHNTQMKAALVTIIRTEGSTPRDLGTQMVVIENGQTIGTIGGGTAEKVISKRTMSFLTADNEVQTDIHRVTISQETVTDKLSVCGANMDVLIEPVLKKDFWQFTQGLQASGKDAVIVTSLFSPFTKSILDLNGNHLFGQTQTGLLLSAKKLQEICSSKRAEVVGIYEESCWLVEPLVITERLLILGAGHVAREVAFYAKPLDFHLCRNCDLESSDRRRVS